VTTSDTTQVPTEPTPSREAVEAALDSWFEETFRGTYPHLQEAVKASHRDRMRAAIAAAMRASAAWPDDREKSP
jgi:hypothetical protein